MFWLWCARVAWVLLPVTAGGALADAISGWPVGPSRTATVMLWIAWSVGLLALLAPRPVGCTLLRVVAPVAVVCAVGSITSATTASSIVAVASTVAAAALALSAPVVTAAGNALAYGDEQRFPLRIPTVLLLGPVPLAVAAIAAGVTVGPLLLADADILAGAVLTAAGLPLAFFVFRALHALSPRWLVIVPAGLTFVDPLTLGEPTLVRREEIEGVARVPAAPVQGALDLRLGTIVGGVVVALTEPVPFARRRGRSRADLVETRIVVVALARPGVLLALARSRRLKTR